MTDKDIRSVDDYTLAIDPLVEGLKQAMNGKAQFGAKLSVASIEVAHDPALRLTLGKNPIGDLCAQLKESLGVTVINLGQSKKNDR